jgi:hypothetical protein
LEISAYSFSKKNKMSFQTVAAAVTSPLTLFPPNFEKLESCFHESKTPEKSFIKLFKFKDEENKNLKVTLVGTVTTNGISVNSWEDRKNFSIGFRFDNDEEITFVEKFLELITKFIGDDYEVKSPLKDDLLYLKLKTKDNTSFAPTKSNLKLSPKKPADSVYQGQSLKATCEFSIYVNFKDKNAGLLITPLELTFDE